VQDFPSGGRNDSAQSDDGDAKRLGRHLLQRGNFNEEWNRENWKILERVGGGDSFESGLITDFLRQGRTVGRELRAEHGGAGMTTHGDNDDDTWKKLCRNERCGRTNPR